MTSGSATAATVTVQRATIATDSSGYSVETYANASGLTSIKCRIYAASANEIERYGLVSDHRVENVAYFDGDRDIRATDLIVWGSQSMRVIGVDKAESPSGGLSYTKAICTETVNSGDASLGR